jgi:hypothetical protein
MAKRPMCVGKKRYKEFDAKSKVELHNITHLIKLNCYPCPECGRWHVTSTKWRRRYGITQ